MKKKKTENSMSLGRVNANTSASIKTLSGDRRFMTKAIGMGITPGSELFIVRNHKIGPVIVFLRDSFIAISRCEAENITVEV